MAYIAAKTLEDALSAVQTPDVSVIAGGTDWYPARGESPLPQNILDISRLDDMRGITQDADSGTWRIGAATRWSDLYKIDLPPAFDGLIAAAREVGSIQIQNAATIMGNLCNASPAADGVPPLLALSAEVELTSQTGRRVLPLAEFITGVRQTALAPGELATALILPHPHEEAKSCFLKLGSRSYLVISIAMVAVTLRLSESKIAEIAVAVGACSPVAQRLSVLEQSLIDRDPAQLSARDILPNHLTPLSPIDDVRGSAEYRLSALNTLILRAIRGAA